MPGRHRDPPTTALKNKPAPFDAQAKTYDQRVGLSETNCRKIVQTIVSLAGVQQGDLVVEVGAGTGQIGQWFALESVRYLGFDLSQAMLDKFQNRLESEGKELSLVQSDGNQRWPLDNGTAKVIFSSRAIHLLEREHVVEEIFRVAKPQEATLLLGRIERQKVSGKAKIQQKMQHLLRDRGFPGREGGKNQHQLIELCCQRGAKKIEPVVISQWKVATTPWQSIESWQNKQGIGGINPPAKIKQEILVELQTWAESTFGGLHQQLESEEAYILHGVRF